MNTSEPPMARAFKIVEDGLGDRGRIVAWRDVRDDTALGEALTSLLRHKAGNRQNRPHEER